MVLFLFILRVLFQIFKAPGNNEFCQLVLKLTNPLVLPLRKVIPQTRYVDLSTLLLWVTIDLFKYILLVYMQTHTVLSTGQLILLLPCDFFMQTTTIIFYATLFYAIMRLVAAGMENTAIETLAILSEPGLRFGRKLISSAGGFDFSPILVLVVLKIIQISITSIIPANYFF